MQFEEFIDIQLTEDRRAFIVHFPAKSGKTAFVKKFSEIQSGVILLDLQEWLLALDEIDDISLIDFDKLEELLLGINEKESVIIIDNCDVLFNTWKDSEKKKLIAWLKVGLRSPGVTTNTFVFVIQTDPYFVNVKLKNSHGFSRILALDVFTAI